MRLPRPLLAVPFLALLGCSPGAMSSMPSMSAGAPSPVASGAASCGEAPADPPGWPSGPGAGDDRPIPILASQDLAVGAQRVLVTLAGPGNEPLAARDLPVRLSLYALARDPERPQVTTDGVFLDPAAGKAGLYRFAADFGCAGEWGLELTLRPGTDAATTSQRLRFDVPAASSTPSVGEAVPPADTPIATTPDAIRQISSDPEPDPDFYRTSITGAIAARKPFVVAFSTPLFCQNALCGPTLDVVKKATQPYTGKVELIHVEPYQLRFEDGQVQPVLGRFPNEPQEAPPHLLPVPAVQAWGLRTEPYVFVVDGQGRLRAKFEGAVDEAELRAALDAALA